MRTLYLQVNVRQMSRMMCIDSTADSHPIIMNATTPEEIVNTFDAVSYEKVNHVVICL